MSSAVINSPPLQPPAPTIGERIEQPHAIARYRREQRDHEQQGQHHPVQRDIVIGVGHRRDDRDDLAIGGGLRRR